MGVGLFTRDRIVAAVLGLIAVILVVLIAHDVFFPPSPAAASAPIRTVQLGAVRSAVTGTGTVVPATQQNMNFAVSGTLSEVDVKAGDQVQAGQVLAKLDPTTYQQALDQANNSLQQAQATLNSTVNGNGVTQASHSLAAAQQALADAQAQVNFTSQQDANAVAADQNQLNADPGAPNLAGDQAALDGDTRTWKDCLKQPPPVDCSAEQAVVQQDQNRVNADQAALAKVQQDQQKLSTDLSKQSQDQLQGQHSINQSSAQVTSAGDQLDSQTITRPNTIASQSAAVGNAQLAVQTAQRNLDSTTLTARFDGTVNSVSGQPGDVVSGGGSGATAQAPGSSAPQPSSSGSTAGAAGGAASSSASSGSGSFVVLSNVAGLQVVAPFAEADAARLQANQQASVTFDAVPGLTVPAHVLAVASAASVISNVTNYYATLIVDRLDQRLKSGMTANAQVVVSQAANVLTVANSAITRLGGTSYVTVLGRDGKTQTRQPIQVGVVGDTTTEVTSGLTEGDRIVLPQLRVPAGQAAQTRGLGGGGGGGGGGVRVGGGGG
jgi:multidrug efflux pump subunit AcrA (membrane-fusion protein)